MRKFDSTKLLRTAVVTAILVCMAVVTAAVARADSEGAGTVTASALNMRSQPSTAGDVVTCLPRGTVVAITGSTDGWYQVGYKGQTGYMSKDYVSVAQSGTGDFGTGTVTGSYVNVRSGPTTAYEAIGQASKGASYKVTGVNGAFYQIDYNGRTAYIYSAYMSLGGGTAQSATPNTESASGIGVITGDWVNMRSGPGTGYAVVGTYNNGTKMTITGQSGDWYKVSVNGQTGYVYKQYLSQSGVTAEVTETQNTPAVTTAGVNLREGPSTAYTSKGVLAKGTAVTITGKSGQWYRVRWSGTSGYIYQDYISTDTNTASSAAPASTNGEKIVAEAKKYMGVRYVYGGTSPSGFDCSGFVYYVYKQCGYSITRTATAQNSVGVKVARSDLQPGDIIIFYNGGKTAIGHAGIYIGDGKFIHASSGGGKVMISGLSESYYNTRFYSARRVA